MNALIRAVVVCVFGSMATATAQERPRPRPLPAASKDMQTGPGVGEKIPAFSLVDQNGQRQSLKTLKGRNGLVLAFVRSADW